MSVAYSDFKMIREDKKGCLAEVTVTTKGWFSTKVEVVEVVKPFSGIYWRFLENFEYCPEHVIEKLEKEWRWKNE